MQNDKAIEPRKATVDSAGHDLFAAEQKALEPGSCNVVSLELNMEIPEGLLVLVWIILLVLMEMWLILAIEGLFRL